MTIMKTMKRMMMTMMSMIMMMITPKKALGVGHLITEPR